MKTAKRNLTLAVAVSVALGGCVADDGTRTRVEGAGVGAVVGGILGYAIGGRDGAAIGAVLGGGIGLAIGNNVAQRKKGYVNLEDALDGEIAYYGKMNQSVARTNRELSSEISRLDRQARSLRRQYRSGQVSKAQMLAKKREINSKYQKNKRYIAELNKQHRQGNNYLNTELSKSSDKSKVARLKNEQRRLQREIQKANSIQRQIARTEQRLST